ncbi:glycoside hydrolase superfamily [Zopfochytrium polystomum]|nr:glycoside hydrolase superfamily [Zopfochytrium polystomum]
MGWSSRQLFGCNTSEKSIKEVADALVSTGLSKAGYSYGIIVNDCWLSESRDPDDFTLVANKSTFPSGMPALASYLHSRDLRLGLTIAASMRSCELPSTPGSWSAEETDAATFAEWGVDYLKYRTCLLHWMNDWRGTVDKYKPMRDALAATGRPIVFAMDNWGMARAWEYGEWLANSWRVTVESCDSYRGWWCSVLGVLDFAIDTARYARPGAFNDLDLLQAGNKGMPLAAYRTQFSAWAALKSPLILAADPRNLSAEAVRILTNEHLIAINQDPLGVSASYATVLQGGFDVWVGPLAGGDRVVMVVKPRGRWEEGRRGRRDAVGRLCWREDERPWDLWADVDGLPATQVIDDGRIVVDVPAYGVKIFRITPVDTPFDFVIPSPTQVVPVFWWWSPGLKVLRWYWCLGRIPVMFFHGFLAALPVLVIVLLAVREVLAMPDPKTATKAKKKAKKE